MEERVEPLAHEHAFAQLHLDLILVEWLEQHEANHAIESSRVQPAWKKSLAHDGSKIALLDVEHVGQSEDSACKVSGLNDTLRVIKSVNNGSVLLPVVVIHLFFRSWESTILIIKQTIFCQT